MKFLCSEKGGKRKAGTSRAIVKKKKERNEETHEGTLNDVSVRNHARSYGGIHAAGTRENFAGEGFIGADGEGRGRLARGGKKKLVEDARRSRGTSPRGREKGQ